MYLSCLAEYRGRMLRRRELREMGRAGGGDVNHVDKVRPEQALK